VVSGDAALLAVLLRRFPADSRHVSSQGLQVTGLVVFAMASTPNFFDSFFSASFSQVPLAKEGALLSLAALLIPMATGHEHGEDKIPEGETVSQDPIVRH